MTVTLLLRSSLFMLAHGHNQCTMAEHNGACTSCGICPFANSNFGCKKYGDIHHAGTNSVKKCLSEDASCGGSQERCYGTIYECEPGYVRPDGTSEYAVSCQNGNLDYGPACVRQIHCNVEDTLTATVVGGPSVIDENANAIYECMPGWIDAVGPPPVTSFTTTCVRHAATPDSDTGVLSPDPASICAIKPGCTDATMSNYDAEATMDDGSCVECFEDLHCTDPSLPVCNTAIGTCVQCTQQSDCASDASQMCDVTSNTCQCAEGYAGTPGPSGVCTPTDQCSVYDTEEVCLSYEGCKWEYGECVTGEPNANKEDADDALPLAVVAGLIGLLLCCLLLCWLCCRSKRKPADEEHEGQLYAKDNASVNASSYSSGSHKSHRHGSRAGSSRRKRV